MGGAVSSGRDNNELIDNLMGGNYIRTRSVERVFRALDRADYMTPEARDQAYKDLAWRNGLLHMSAPCIYSEVMEGLELKPGLSFLNVGSGTGYLSTLVGLILGSGGISHGIEVHSSVVDYATKKLSQFLENSPTLDEFDFCEPKFYCGNGLCLAPLQAPYDRVYCGAGCPEEYQNYFKQLIKIGGILVMPLNDNLLQVRRVATAEWRTRSLLNVSFATLRVPERDKPVDIIRLDELTPPRLQALSRAAVRGAMRAALLSRHPALREPPPRAPTARRTQPRRICIPLDGDSDENLNALHDLDPANGANEMNALLSLVLSMGHNRVAGALRFDPIDSAHSSDSSHSSHSSHSSRSARSPRSPRSPRSVRSADSSDDDDDGGGDPGSGGAAVAEPNRLSSGAADGDRNGNPERPPAPAPVGRSVIMFEFRDSGDPGDGDAPAAPSADDGKPSKSTKKHDVTKTDDPDKVPPEVEIYLEDEAEAPSTSAMEWDKAPEAKREHSSDDETTESTSKAKEEKRQKFDSGLGEENTPSSGSSPDKSTRSEESEAAESHASEGVADEGCAAPRGRRRLQKRARGQLDPRSSSSTEAEDEAEGARRHKRRAGDGGDARRVRLSLMMKRGVKELPLPHALKMYVNYGRCFQF